MEEIKKGKLIVIEGLDGSGKTVQWKMLGQALKDKGQSVKFVDFPQYSSASAGLINNYLRDIYGSANDVSPFASSLFYAVDRFDLAHNVRGNMTDWLNNGRIVLANRYTPSNGYHQGGKISDEEERKKFLHWLFNLEYKILGIPKPDLNIFLNVPLEVSRVLREKRGATFYDAHESNEQHLINAESAFKTMVQEFPEDFAVIECIRDGELISKEEIHEKILKVVSEKLGL